MGEDDANLSPSLTKWGASHGAMINGVSAHQFPGKGLGIVAERRLEAGETILEIPLSLIKTEYSLPKRLRKAIPVGECCINGLLALDLALDNSSSHALWRSTLPSLLSFKSSMPLFWPVTLQLLLPPTSTTLLHKQQRKLHRDWTAIHPKFPTLSLEQYTYHWLLVSTRTFYYTPPNMPADETPDADECLAIVPFGDYLNHSSSSSTGSCKVNYSPTGYEFQTVTQTERGQELFISYGSHGNDFLLVEYGFILPLSETTHDGLALDEFILPLFSPEQKKLLKGADYLGNYTLNQQPDTNPEDENVNGHLPDDFSDTWTDDSPLTCYRTTTALRLLCMALRKWKRGLTHGFDDNDTYTPRILELLAQVLGKYKALAEERLEKIATVETEAEDGEGWSEQKDVLRRRWGQILVQVKGALGRLELSMGKEE